MREVADGRDSESGPAVAGAIEDGMECELVQTM